MLLLAHPTGNANVRAAAKAFHSAGLLAELHSCLCWDPQHPLARLLPPGLASQLRRRTFADVPVSLQHSHPLRELLRLAGAGNLLPALQRHERGLLSIDGIYRSFDRQVAARLPFLVGIGSVYGYEDGSLRTFQMAQRLGLRRFYDLPIGYWRAAQQIFEEERDLQPEWACTLTGLEDSPGKLARKDQEIQLADQVVVASAYVRSTLQRYNACSAPIAVVPYGCPPPLENAPATPSTGPLRVLWVGALGQRKGLSYLLDAVEALGDEVSLTLIGRPTSSNCIPLNAALERYQWIPSLPHDQILSRMRQHDVLVFPTLFDGFGLVITEALSQGLPVIATGHSGAPECLRDGVEGFLVPIRSSQAIAERLFQLARNREQLDAMRRACLKRARQLSWTDYGAGLSALLHP